MIEFNLISYLANLRCAKFFVRSPFLFGTIQIHLKKKKITTQTDLTGFELGHLKAKGERLTHYLRIA